MDWDKLKIFHAVAEAGSFTNATVNLNLSQSAISRQIQSLEQDLKVQLFERHARGLTLTENGEYADYRSGAMGTTENIYAYGFKDTSDVELDNDLVATNYNDELLTFGVWEIVLPAGVSQASDIFVNKAASIEVDGFGSASIAVDQGESTVGASTSLLSWSYTNSKEGLGF